MLSIIFVTLFMSIRFDDTRFLCDYAELLLAPLSMKDRNIIFAYLDRNIDEVLKLVNTVFS